MSATKKIVKENQQQKAEREMWAELEIKIRYTKYRHAFQRGITPNF
jgi:hypothetical protein